MMQMLAAGGVPVMTDARRQADEDNRRGYYEFEPVKTTKADASWLDQAPGKAVKLVFALLHDLPGEFRYRVVFMQRKLEEVLASQKIMLQRSGQDADAVKDEDMMRLFQKALARTEAWLRQQPNFEVLYVDYNRLVADPAPWAQRINDFLGGRLDVAAMIAAVDPVQYRNRR